MIGTLDIEDSTKIIKVHIMIGDSRSSWAEECKIVLEYNIRVRRVESNNNYKKRETE